jgi:hypothetical protein
MKTRFITIGLASLAVIIFAATDAHGNPPADISLALFGGNFITSTVDGQPSPLDGQALTALQSGIAKGAGKPLFVSQAVLDQVPQNPLEFPPDCLAQGLAGSTLSTTIVLTYNDGSLLSISTDEGSYFCTDGTVFTVSFGGNVTGGEGRFEGATGTWEGTASSVSARVVAEINIDLGN